GLALQALARWIHFIGLALTFGVVAYGALIKRAGAPLRLVGAGLVLLIAAEPVSLIAQLASLSFDGDTALAVLGSNFGRLLGLRLGAALLAWTVLATGRSWPVLALGAALAALRLRRHRGELALATLVIGAAAVVAALPPPI